MGGDYCDQDALMAVNGASMANFMRLASKPNPVDGVPPAWYNDLRAMEKAYAQGSITKDMMHFAFAGFDKNLIPANMSRTVGYHKQVIDKWHEVHAGTLDTKESVACITREVLSRNLTGLFKDKKI